MAQGKGVVPRRSPSYPVTLLCPQEIYYATGKTLGRPINGHGNNDVNGPKTHVVTALKLVFSEYHKLTVHFTKEAAVAEGAA